MDKEILLTGKCKLDFEKWLNDEELRSDTIESLKVADKLFYIVKWMDNLKHENGRFYSSIFEKCFAIKAGFMSFFDVSIQAIDVCNIRYNQLHK